MRRLIATAFFVLLPVLASATPATGPLVEQAAARFAALALGCGQLEYPNKISHVSPHEA